MRPNQCFSQAATSLGAGQMLIWAHLFSMLFAEGYAPLCFCFTSQDKGASRGPLEDLLLHLCMRGLKHLPLSVPLRQFLTE